MTINATALLGARTVDGSIKQYVNHSEVPSAIMLVQAEQWIYDRLRIREMQTAAAGTLSAAADTLSLPARYRQPYHFMFTGNGTVSKSIPTHTTLDVVIGRFEYDSSGNRTTGRPQIWSTDAANVQFDRKADQAYPYRFDYYQALAPLAASTNETNVLTDRFPRLLYAACNAMAQEWLKNEREKSYWLSIAMGEIERANATSDMELDGAEIIVRPI